MVMLAKIKTGIGSNNFGFLLNDNVFISFISPVLYALKGVVVQLII